jgi:hypothetical protein
VVARAGAPLGGRVAHVAHLVRGERDLLDQPTRIVRDKIELQQERLTLGLARGREGLRLARGAPLLETWASGDLLAHLGAHLVDAG